MSFRTNPLVAAALIVLSFPALVNPALAAASECPAQLDGHRLRMSVGGSLYLGDPVDNMLQAPDGTHPGPNGPVNVWTFHGGSGLTLICHYDGVRKPVSLMLTADVSSCRQDVNARTFICK